jgi:hypothetical protein
MVDHFPKVAHVLNADVAALLDPKELARACTVSKGWKAQLTHVLVAKCNCAIKEHEAIQLKQEPSDSSATDSCTPKAPTLGIAAAYFQRAMVQEIGGQYTKAHDDFKLAASFANGERVSIQPMAKFHQAKCLAAARQAALHHSPGFETMSEQVRTTACYEQEDELLIEVLQLDPAHAPAALVLSSNYSVKRQFEHAESVLSSTIHALRQYHRPGNGRGSTDSVNNDEALASKSVHSLARLYFATGVLLERGPWNNRTLEAVTAFSKAMELDGGLMRQVVQRRSMLFVMPAVPVVLPVVLAWKVVRYSPWAAWELLRGAGHVTVSAHQQVVAPSARFAGRTIVAGVLATRDYVIVPTADAFKYSVALLGRGVSCGVSLAGTGVSLVGTTIVDFVILPTCDYVLVPLKDGTVYVARSAAWAIAKTAAGTRDYVLVPLKDGTVYAARSAAWAIAKTAAGTRDYVLVPLKDGTVYVANLLCWLGYHAICRPVYWTGLYTVRYLGVSAKFIYHTLASVAAGAWRVASAVASNTRAGVLAATSFVWRLLLLPVMQMAAAVASVAWQGMVLPVWRSLQALAIAVVSRGGAAASAVATAAYAIWAPVAAAAMSVWRGAVAIMVVLGSAVAAVASAAVASAVAAGASASAVASILGSAVFSFASSVWNAVAALFRALL